MEAMLCDPDSCVSSFTMFTVITYFQRYILVTVFPLIIAVLRFSPPLTEIFKIIAPPLSLSSLSFIPRLLIKIGTLVNKLVSFHLLICLQLSSYNNDQ